MRRPTPVNVSPPSLKNADQRFSSQSGPGFERLGLSGTAQCPPQYRTHSILRPPLGRSTPSISWCDEPVFELATPDLHPTTPMSW